MKKTYEALQKAIEIVKPGTMYRDVGNTIGKFIEGKIIIIINYFSLLLDFIF